MAKFHGIIGFVITRETKPGIWKNVAEEKVYSGNVLRKLDRSVTSEYLNDNIIFNNQISIIADPFASQHFSSIKYVEWHGVKWKVTNVDPVFPRLNLTLGEVYNGEQT